jgi:adenosylcobinamide-phosphate synthase
VNGWLVFGAFGLDLLLGDPRGWPHPVVWIGRLIQRCENFWTACLGRSRLAGILLTLSTLLMTGGAAWGLLTLAGAVHPWLQIAAGLWLAWTCLALRSLHRESLEVVRHLEAGDLDAARRALSLIVGRDTAGLDEAGILRATIETVAENTSDGVVAPLFYLCLGGPVLGILFKAVSTLDSMVGYENECYREVGWASARLDDLLNLIPARLTGLLMILAAVFLRLNAWGALKIMRRDGRKPKSPNAGIPEAAVAGALDIRLGGPAVYFGKLVEKPALGDDDRPVRPAAYRGAVCLMYLASLFTLGLGLISFGVWR